MSAGASVLLSGVVLHAQRGRVVRQLLVADGVHDQRPGVVVALLDHCLQLEGRGIGSQGLVQRGRAGFNEVVVRFRCQDLGGAGGLKRVLDAVLMDLLAVGPAETSMSATPI